MTQGNRRNRYTKEFKESLVKLHLEGRSVTSLSKEFGPHVTSIHQWIIAAREKREMGPSGDELKRLRLENKRLQNENII